MPFCPPDVLPLTFWFDVIGFSFCCCLKEGTVYIKAASSDEAGKLFRVLHGQWYRGQLVTVKYLREERYFERFPAARHQTGLL